MTEVVRRCRDKVSKKTDEVFKQLSNTHGDLVLVSTLEEASKFKQSEVIEDFSNKVLPQRC